MRMKAAEIRASTAIADCTLLTVVFRSLTTAEMETFISEVSTTSTNIAAARSKERRVFPASFPPKSGCRSTDTWQGYSQIASSAVANRLGNGAGERP